MSPQNFTERLNDVIRQAVEVARLACHEFVTPEHFLAALLSDEEGVAGAVLAGMRVDRDRLRERLLEGLKPRSGESVVEGQLEYTARARKALSLAQMEADSLGNAYVGTEHLLLGILVERGPGADLISEMGGSLASAREQVGRLAGVEHYTAHRGLGVAPSPAPSLLEDFSSSEGEGEVGVAGMSALARFCRDLTAQARAGKLDPVVGREAEVSRVEEILCRRKKNNPVLVGEAGVGKTAVVEGLAQRIVDNRVAVPLRGRRVLSLDLPALLAGTQLRGQFEDRLRALVSEVQASQDVILFVDELHTLMGAGAGEGAIDAVNILKPALARGELQCLGATTLKEYRQYIEKDEALERRFQPVRVNAPSAEEALLILQGIAGQYESFHGVSLPTEVLGAAVRLSERYVHDRQLPDKAIDLIDEACARVVIAASAEGFVPGAGEVTPVVEVSDVAGVVATWTGIPVDRLTREQAEKLLHLEQELGERVIGQPRALERVAEAVRRGRSGLADPARPVGSFLFAGPTGVGKTEVARSLAEILFDSKDALIRVDMSEHMERHTVSRLIGAPPGYVGYEEGGTLTEQVRSRPYSVVLLDEIEKAHPDVFNLLLQVLDDGHLTDSHGRLVSFKNCLIIMTTNLGAEALAAPATRVGFHAQGGGGVSESAEERVMEAIEAELKPEFINRIDDIVVFHSLGFEHVTRIAGILLAGLEVRLSEAGMSLEITDGAMEFLVERGYQPKYGARPLKRAIQRYVTNPLSAALLKGEFHRGDRIRVEEGIGDVLRFSPVRAGGISVGAEAWSRAVPVGSR